MEVPDHLIETHKQLEQAYKQQVIPYWYFLLCARSLGMYLTVKEQRFLSWKLNN